MQSQGAFSLYLRISARVRVRFKVRVVVRVKFRVKVIPMCLRKSLISQQNPVPYWFKKDKILIGSKKTGG